MTIVATYQDSPEGHAAVQAAVAEAALRRTDVVVLAPPTERGGPPDIPAALLPSPGDTAAPAVTVRAAVRAADLAGEVVDLATELAAELIVIGMRRRSPVGKLLLGSAAQQILLDATVPVLAVRVRS